MSKTSQHTKDRRAFIVVIDSVGAGGATDAADFGDVGSNTLGHIAEYCAKNGHDFSVPTLSHLGLGQVLKAASGLEIPALTHPKPRGLYGAAQEHSQGKDTPSGHWEIAGVPVPWDWHYFPNEIPAFPSDILEKIEAEAGVKFIGLKHASGTGIINELGELHMKTGQPIAYTSIDSVFQIAAHEEVFGLERLYELCKISAKHWHPLLVGRVIARPFVGAPGHFKRTPNRHDYAIAPPEPTILDRAQEAGHHTIGIGKIRDIFSGRGLDEIHAGKPDRELYDDLDSAVQNAPSGSLTFVNLVEFDTNFGHMRDPLGYKEALEWFDSRLALTLPQLRENDLLIVTADHGNDPTWPGTDHTRERVPVLGYAPSLGALNLGLVDFADIGASVLDFLGIAPGPHGQSFLEPLLIKLGA